MKTYLLMALLAGGLTGCVDHVVEPRGTVVEAVPVHYEFSTTSLKRTEIAPRLEHFIQQHQLQGSAVSWQVATRSASMASLVDKVLDKHQVPNARRVNNSLPPDSRFSVSIVATDIQVRLEVCHQEKVGQYGSGHQGCYTDGNRWQSMVNPDKSM